MRRHDFSQRYCKSFAIGRRQTGMSVRSHRRVTPVQHNHAVCRAAYAPHPHRAKRSGLDRVLCGSDVPCLIRRIEDSSVKKGAMLRSRRDGPGSSGASVSHREPSRPASSTNQRQASCGRPRRARSGERPGDCRWRARSRAARRAGIEQSGISRVSRTSLTSWPQWVAAAVSEMGQPKATISACAAAAVAAISMCCGNAAPIGLALPLRVLPMVSS